MKKLLLCCIGIVPLLGGGFGAIKETAKCYNLGILYYFHIDGEKKLPKNFERQQQNIFIAVDVPLADTKDLEKLEEAHLLKEELKVDHLPSYVLVDEQHHIVGKYPDHMSNAADFQHFIFATWSKYLSLRQLTMKENLQQIPTQKLQKLYQEAKAEGFEDLVQIFLDVGLQKDEGVFFLLEKYIQLAHSGQYKSSLSSTIKQKILERDPKNLYGAKERMELFDGQMTQPNP